MIWIYLLIKSANLIQKIQSIKRKIQTIVKFVKNLFQKLRGLKSTKFPTCNLASINLLIIRDTFTEKSTIGKLFLNGEWLCDTLELPYINNEKSISCIPEAEYKVRLRTAKESATRNYLHLLVEDVKDRKFILVHIGNSARDSRGCVLVGIGREQDFVKNSRLAMDLLVKEILNLGGTNINLIIKNR
jgi:hypothetical protein